MLAALTDSGGANFALARAFLAARLREAQQEGDVGAIDVEQAAELLVRLCVSFVLIQDSVLPLDDPEPGRRSRPPPDCSGGRPGRLAEQEVGTACKSTRYCAPVSGTKTSPKKKRRTQAERRAATRGALLDATIDCLVEFGYANTTTNRIVETGRRLARAPRSTTTRPRPSSSPKRSATWRRGGRPSCSSCSRTRRPGRGASRS